MKSAFLLLVAIALLSSTGASVPTSKVSRQQREKAVSTLDKLYAQYLAGTLTVARSNMVKACDFIAENSVRIPELRGAFPICYARLSLLERKAGNEALSLLYYEKSRYWHIVERERLGLKPEQILADHQAFTRDESHKFALEWDKKRSNGRGPVYLKEI